MNEDNTGCRIAAWIQVTQAEQEDVQCPTFRAGRTLFPKFGKLSRLRLRLVYTHFLGLRGEIISRPVHT